MKKKWYKRIFAGILALALTATSFSGDIENLVKAVGSDTETLMGGYVEAYYTGGDYQNPTSLNFELCNYSEVTAATVNYTLVAEQIGAGGQSISRVNYTNSVTIPVAYEGGDPGRSGDITVPLTSASPSFSLSSSESLHIYLTINSSTVDNSSLGIFHSGSTYFNVVCSGSPADEGSYSVVLPDTSTTLFVGDTYSAPITITNGYKREITSYNSSNPSVATVAVSDGVLTVTPVAQGTATVTVGTTKTTATLNVTVADVSIAPTSGDYNGSQHNPTVQVGTNYVSPNWNGNMIDAGRYEGTFEYPIGSNINRKVAYTINPLSVSDATAGTLKVNNKGEVSGTVVVGTRSVEVNAGNGIDAVAVYTGQGGTSPKYSIYDVTVSGSGNYKDSKVFTGLQAPIIPSDPVDITNDLSITVAQFPGYTYTGSEIRPGVDEGITSKANLTVRYKGRELTEGTVVAGRGLQLLDGTEVLAFASYENNINAGDATIVITGNIDAGYTGSKSARFEIDPLDIISTTITLPNAVETYTGTAIEPVPVVEYNGKTLAPGVDYDVVYSSNTDIGTARVFLYGKGNLEGDTIKTFKIIGTLPMATVMLDGVADFSIDYTGVAIEPEVTGYIGKSSNRIKKDTDFTVSYSNNVNAGTATVTLTGKEGSIYAGQTKTVSFTINKIPLPDKLVVSDATGNSRTYTGNEIRLTQSATDGFNLPGLVYGQDYTGETFTNNVNAGTATVTVKGAGNYTGTASANYKITSCDLEKAYTDGKVTVTVNGGNAVTYTGSKVTPPVVVTLYGNVLDPANYEVQYYNNQDVGTGAQAIVVAKGSNVIGRLTKTFQIKGKTLTDCTITLNNTPVTFNYKGNPSDGVCSYETEYTGYYAPINLVVRDGGTIVPVGQYGPVTSSSETINVHLGADGKLERNQNFIVVKGKDGGMFDGSQVKIYFTITPRDIKNVEDSKWVVGTATKNASGKYEPALSATDRPKDRTYVLTKDTHFTVEVPDDATGPGEYTAKIHGKGNYWDGNDNTPKTISYIVGAKADTLDVRLYPGDTSTDAEEFKTKVGDVIQTDFLGRHPAVKVFANGTMVPDPTSEFDYIWSSDNYTADGLTRTLTVKAKSTSANYFGETTIKYTINPITLEKLQSQGVLQLVADTGAASTRVGGVDKLDIDYDGKAHVLNTFKLRRLEAQGSPAVVYEFKTTDITYSLNQVGPNYTDDPAQTNLTVTAIGSNYSGTAAFTVQIKKKPITSSGITVTPEYTSTTYTGSALEPKITVKDGSKTLEKDVDYTVAYSDNIAAGTATYTVTGMGNYDGTTSGTFTIGKIDVSKFEVRFDIEEVPYDGTEQKPGYTIYYNNVVLDNSKFDAVYSDNVDPGKAKLRISAKADDPQYTGAQDFAFRIRCDLKDAKVETKEGLPKSTITIRPTSTMDDIADLLNVTTKYAFLTFEHLDGTKETLQYGKDYVLKSFTPVLGKTTIVIEGVDPDEKDERKGRFNGTLEYEVSLKGDINDAKVVDRNPEEFYTGEEIDHSGKISLTWGGKTISKDAYTLTDMIKTDANEYTYDVNTKFVLGESDVWSTSGTKSDQDGKSLSYKIMYNLNEMGVQLIGLQTETKATGTVYYSPYTGNTVKPTKVQLQLGGTQVSKINENSDYVIEYNPADPKAPGTVVVSILPATGAGSRGLTVGSATATYEIRGVNLERVDVNADSQSFTYDGTAKVPNISVRAIRDGSSVTVPADNYVITYYDSNGQPLTNCINAGTYYVVATGVDGYTGTTGKTDVSAKFVIEPYDISTHFNNMQPFTAGDVSALVKDTPVYTGSPIEPSITVEYHTSPNSAKALKEGQDYKITFPDPSKNINVCKYEDNKAYFQIEGIGNYTGEPFNCYFEIDPAEIRNIMLEKKEAPYTGKDINLSSDSILQVKDDKGNPLKWDVDFTVSPLTVKNKGTYNITITGKGNYKNEDTTVDIHGDPLVFTVTARNFEDNYIYVTLGGEETDQTANGEVSRWSTESYTAAPAVVVVDKFGDGPTDDKTLVAGEDYDIVGFFNTDVTSADGSLCDPAVTPYVEIKAHDGSDYEGTKRIFFSIGKPFTGAYIEKVAPFPNTFTYNGGPQSPKDSKIVVHAADGTVIPQGTSRGGYSISWYDDETGKADITNAGQKNIIVTGNKNYFGTIDKDNATPPQIVSYTIEPKTVGPNDVTITCPGLIKDTDGAYITYWTGEPITPDVKVWDKQIGRTLIEDVDYDVVYGTDLVDNISVTPEGGTPVTITIRTKGNYKNGDVAPTAQFKIKPIPIDLKNIEVKWTDYVPDVGDNVVDWYEGVSPADTLVPPYVVTYTDDAGNATILKRELGDYTVSYRYLDGDGSYVNYGDPEFNWYAGEMELVVIGGGNYSGVVTKPYYIRADLSDDYLHDNPERYIDPATITEPFYTGEIPVLENLSMKYASKDSLKLPSSADKIDSPKGTVVWQNDYFRIEFDNDRGDDNQTGHMKLTSRNNNIYYGTFEYRFPTETNINTIRYRTFKNTYPYTGAPVNLDYTLETDRGSAVNKNVVKSVEFKDSHGNSVTAPIEVGEYKAIVTVEIDTESKKLPEQTFWIQAGDLTGANIICTDPQTYTGGAIKPEVLVYLGKYKLTEGVDYTVNYPDPDHTVLYQGVVCDNKTPVSYTDAHTGTDKGLIQITGMGNYSGTAFKTFEINPASPKHLVVDNQQSTALRVGWVRNEHVGEWIVECRANSASAEPVAIKHVGPLDNFAEITGLTPGTQYYITVYSKAEGVTGEALTISDSSAKTTVADITGVIPTVSGNQVALTWNPVPGAFGYEIIRSNDINQNYRLVASFPATYGGWTNSNLKPGTYYFKIRAYSVDANRVVTYGGYSDPVMVVIP